MDKAIVNALARREELRREIDEIEAFLGMYRRFGGETNVEHAVMRASSPRGDATESDSPATRPTISVTVRQRTRRASPEQIADAAIRTILDVGKPLSRADLANALEERGMELQTKDPANYIGTIMWRHGKDRVISLDGLGYWPIDRAYEPAGYEPGTPSANFLKTASDNAAAVFEDYEPSSDDERDAQFDRETDESAANIEAESKKENSWVAPPPPPPPEEAVSTQPAPRARPARDVNSSGEEFFKHVFGGSRR